MAVALVMSLILVVLLFSYNRQKLIAGEMAERASDLLADLEDTLEELPVADQHRWILATARPYAIHVVPLNATERPPANGRYNSLLGRTIAQTIHERIVSATEVREQRSPKQQLWVKVELLGESYWLVIPMARLHNDSTWEFAASALLLVMAMLAAAATFAWRINLPLRKLRMAAGRLGRGEKPEPLPETGPLEVKELSASFNRMLADLDINARERAVMLAGISHDLRTPLARLKLGVEMMADMSLQGGMQQDVEDIERILQQFIDFARGDGGEEPRDIDLVDLARGIAERYARAGTQLQLDFADDLPLLPARPLALSRALSNLIDNSRRYGIPPITLALSHEAGAVLLAVSDCGEGIAPERVQDALKPFHRLDAGRRADGGSGLGLAIVQRIARLHGGDLSLNKLPGGGFSAIIRIEVPPQS